MHSLPCYFCVHTITISIESIELSNSDVLTCSSGEAEDEISAIESLQFDFGKIRVATQNFSDASKLGKGGFGIVYKVM